MTASNVQHVDLTPVSSSTLINVADSTNVFTQVGGRIALNNAGTVVFSGMNTLGAGVNSGIFTGNGSVTILVADSTTVGSRYFSRGPSGISDSGTTVFIGTGVESPNQKVVVHKNGSYSAVVANNGSQFEYLSNAAINISGQVGFTTDDYSTGNNNGAFAYRTNPGTAPFKISRVVTATSVGVNDAGVMSFEAAAADGNSFSSTGLVTRTALKQPSLPKPVV